MRKATTRGTSDQSFALAALDSQSFIRKITLRIIPDAISHIGTRWNAAANKRTIASLLRESVIYHKENGIGKNYDILRRNDPKLEGKLVDRILRTSGHAARDHCEKIAQIVKDLFGTTDEPAMNHVKKELFRLLQSRSRTALKSLL